MFGRHTDSMSKNVKVILQPIVNALAEKCTGIATKAELESYEIHVSKEDYSLIEDNKILIRGLFQPSFSAKFALYEWDSVFYLVETGMPELSAKTGSGIGYLGIDNEDNEVLYFLFLSQAGLQVNDTAKVGEIYNTVFTEDNKTDRISRDVIELLFPEVNIYKLDKVKIPLAGSIDEYNLKQLTLKYICAVFQENPFTPVKISTDAIALYEKLSENADHLVPIDNLVQSILAYRWNFVFLDLYRCIERLYVIGWVLDYTTTFGSSLGKEEIHTKLLDRSVAHHEDEIIKYLFTLLDAGILAGLDPIRDKTEHSVFIYDLRNSIVHYQTSDVKHTDEEWNAISLFLLKAIDKLYTVLASDIKQLGNKEFKKDKSVVAATTA